MFRNTMLAMLIVLVAGPVLRADEEADKWLKFFVGEWTRKREIQTEGEEKVVDTAKWKLKLVAGGKAAMSEGEWASGTKWVMIAGTGPGKFHFERGINSAGIDWSIDYRKVDANTLRGKSTGVAEGQKFQGTITLRRMDENTYTVTWQATAANGKVTKATATNIRTTDQGSE